jgi:hypothetical protein
MDLCGLEDDLLRKIFLVLLSVSVLRLPRSNYYRGHFRDKDLRVLPPHLMLGMACKRLRALFRMQQIEEHVMPLLRTIRYDFFRGVAVTAAHAVGTRPHAQILLTARLHMNAQWLRVVTTVNDDEFGHMLSLVVTAGNTNDLRRQRIHVRIDISRISTLASTPAADRQQFLAIECLVAFQEIFARILRRRRRVYTQECCLFLL